MLNKAIINTRIIRENAIAAKKLLPTGTRFCAVVKADAYGHGAEKVAAALYGIADCFAVALVEEGLRLRLSGIDKDILVLSRAVFSDYALAARYNLTFTATCIEDIKQMQRFCRGCGETLSVHIKYDTGMHRQGISDLSQLERALFLAENSGVKIEGTYSHYAYPENDYERNKATNAFLLANNLVKRYNNKAICHISASGGALKGEFFDMVRIGILLYGYKPFPAKINVRPAMKIYAPVIGERILKGGESALYGFCPTDKAVRLSLARYGYADGLPRKNIQGLFNNRCMDVSAYTDMKSGKNFVCVMDDADRIATKYGTVSYEVLTKSAMRTEKIYTDR